MPRNLGIAPRTGSRLPSPRAEPPHDGRALQQTDRRRAAHAPQWARPPEERSAFELSRLGRQGRRGCAWQEQRRANRVRGGHTPGQTVAVTPTRTRPVKCRMSVEIAPLFPTCRAKPTRARRYRMATGLARSGVALHRGHPTCRSLVCCSRRFAISRSNSSSVSGMVTPPLKNGFESLLSAT